MASMNASYAVCVLFILLNLVSLALPSEPGQSCSWSNEDCSSDKECCSGSCYRAFEGTNSRCRYSTMGEKCIFTFHCADDLECGPGFNCCAPYWKMCTKDSDCCDPMHTCKPADGFYYDRCLYPNSATSVHARWGKSSIILFLKPAFSCLTVIILSHCITTQNWLGKIS